MIRDVLAAVGAALLVAGAWLAYPPAGVIVAGAVLIAVSFILVLGRKEDEK